MSEQIKQVSPTELALRRLWAIIHPVILFVQNRDNTQQGNLYNLPEDVYFNDAQYRIRVHLREIERIEEAGRGDLATIHLKNTTFNNNPTHKPYIFTGIGLNPREQDTRNLIAILLNTKPEEDGNHYVLGSGNDIIRITTEKATKIMEIVRKQFPNLTSSDVKYSSDPIEYSNIRRLPLHIINVRQATNFYKNVDSPGNPLVYLYNDKDPSSHILLDKKMITKLVCLLTGECDDDGNYLFSFEPVGYQTTAHIISKQLVIEIYEGCKELFPEQSNSPK